MHTKTNVENTSRKRNKLKNFQFGRQRTDIEIFLYILNRAAENLQCSRGTHILRTVHYKTWSVP